MPRKTATFVTCDEHSCRVSAEVIETNEAPEGWILVQVTRPDEKVGNTYDRQHAFEFHSLKCVARWARDRQEVTSPTPRVSRNGNTPTAATLILDTLREMGELSSPEIRELIGRVQSVTDKALRQLTSEGAITMTHPGGQGPNDPRRYSLSETERG